MAIREILKHVYYLDSRNNIHEVVKHMYCGQKDDDSTWNHNELRWTAAIKSNMSVISSDIIHRTADKKFKSYDTRI